MGNRIFKTDKLLILGIAGVLASCSVKEERSECPCYLSVDLSESLDAGIIPVSSWEFGLHAVLFKDSVVFSDIGLQYEEAGRGLSKNVPKGMIPVSCFIGAENSRLKGNRLYLQDGNQADPLYASSDIADCTGETGSVSARFHKQFSDVIVTGLKDSLHIKKVVGNCGGLDLSTLKAFDGHFSFAIDCDSSGICSFRLPRMADDAVYIMLYNKEGHLNDAIPLGYYLTASGYDWTAESLQDISVKIDRITSSITVYISGWTQVIEFDYKL